MKISVSRNLWRKFQSTKWWVTIWAIAMITYIVAADKNDFYGIAQLLCAIPLSYVAANVAQKAIYSKTDKKED